LGKKRNIHILRYLFIIILICNFSIGKGQNMSAPDRSIETEQSPIKIHSPHKATMYSALIPGLGQIYNEKYWKLPIIYGLTGVFIYAFDFNNTNYNKFRNAYTDMKAGRIDSFQGYTDEKILLRLKDNYQRNRDLNVIVLAGIYMLNIIDATVDAHLFNYDISEDLSLNIQPSLNKTFDNQHAIGVSCSFSF